MSAIETLPTPADTVARILGPLRAVATDLLRAEIDQPTARDQAREALAALVRADLGELAHAVRAGGLQEFEAIALELAPVVRAADLERLRKALRAIPAPVARRVHNVDRAELPEVDVLALLQRPDEEAPPKSNRHNMALILERDTRWSGRIRYNEFKQAVEVDGVSIRDSGVTKIARFFECVYGLSVPTGMVCEVVELVAEADTFNPVRDYLDGLEWDGQERLVTLLADYFGATATELHGIMSEKWLIGGVARAYKPGVKLDTCVILTGSQGARKSSALRALASDAWFADSTVNLSDKDRFQVLDGRWIYELGEVDAWKKHDLAEIKNYISSQEDNYRRSHGHYAVQVPRRVVFVGTTNENEFLSDPSGDRRWWPVRAGAIDLDGLRRDRDQLWAEAVYRWRSGASWWLTAEEEAKRQEAAKPFRTLDAWEPPIVDWLRGKSPPFTVVEIAKGALDLRPADVDKGKQARITNILRKRGWTNQRGARDDSTGTRPWLWRPEVEETSGQAQATEDDEIPPHPGLD